MQNQISVRYGRNYNVVLAIVLPCLSIVPFILFMQAYKHMQAWKVWIAIFAFLALVISLSIWLAIKGYPPTVLNISNHEISLSFEPGNFLRPSDFTVNIVDIISCTRKEMGGDEYYVFKTKNPVRTFQLSASSVSLEHLLSFSEAMEEISERVNELFEA